MNWAITYYSESVQTDILDLPAGFLARYLRYADRMEVSGPDLGMPHTRVFYCTMIGKRIMILHQFTKKTKKTPPKEPGVARRRMKEVKDADTQTI